MTPAERAALFAEIEAVEWAADGGDGYVLSLADGPELAELDIEWMLRGALLEAMAAVTLRPAEARSIALEESENSSEVAE